MTKVSDCERVEVPQRVPQLRGPLELQRRRRFLHLRPDARRRPACVAAQDVQHLLERRDSFTPSDMIWLWVDSFHDRRTGYEFGVNAAGVKMDLAVYNDGNEDDAWDGVWDVVTRTDSLGWTAEYRIEKDGSFSVEGLDEESISELQDSFTADTSDPFVTVFKRGDSE